MGAETAPAEQFGPYVVYERLGVGGMATVHRALEHGAAGFERVVALKRLLPHLAEDASFIKSFVREAKLASLLSHVNIVQIFDLGRVGTEYFITMEYIDGRDVREVLRHARKVTGPPPMNVTIGLMMQLCEALDYAHGKVDDAGRPLGLVHRDVSPSNLLVTSAGHLKVIDFGIAKAQSSQLRTQTGRVKGKLAYMAPEAASGSRDLDARTDLWAVGVICHELLTARPLFASKNEYQTLLNVQRAELLPPSTFNHACPAELDAVVLKALAREPDRRFAEAGELRNELLRVCRQYNLATGPRDIAAWTKWAFSVEPASFSATATTGVGSSPLKPRKTPRPPRSDEDEAVEIAWGGGEVVDSGPLVLEDVPDVSERLVRPQEPIDDDDQPTPLPLQNRLRAGDASGRVRAPSEAGLPPKTIDPALSAGTDPPRSRAARLPSVPPVTRPASATRPPTLRPGSAAEGEGSAEPTGTSDLGLRTSEPTLVDPVLAVAPMLAANPTLASDPAPAEVRSPRSEVPAARRASPSEVPLLGSGLVARHRKRSSWIAPLVVVVLLGGGAMALIWTPGKHEQTPPPAAVTATTGTLKLIVEPADAEARIDDRPAHVGTPWSLELAAGVHQVELHRAGYKSWLTSVELSASEKQTLRVALEALGPTAAEHKASLAIRTSPPGLEVVLDNVALADRTPIRLEIAPGQHAIAIRQDGAYVWRHTFTAAADSINEFDPILTAEKQRERERMTASAPPLARAGTASIAVPTANAGSPASPASEPIASADSVPPTSLDSTPSATTDTPATADDTPTLPIPPPMPPVDLPKPEAPLPAPATITSVAPTAPAAIVVAPNAVKKLAGDPPSISTHDAPDLPPIVAAKMCIDTSGHVTSVDVISKIDRRPANELASTLRGWSYAPYRKNGAAVPACFTLALRVK